MKEILSSQSDGITGGWRDQDGSGYQPVINGGSQSGNGNNGNHDTQSFLVQSAPYEGGSDASGIGCTKSTYNTSGGYHNNGTGSRSNLRVSGYNH